MARVRAGRRLFPFEDLAISDPTQTFLEIDLDTLYMGLGVMVGMGPNQPHLLRVDETGALVQSQAPASAGAVFIADASASGQIGVRIGNDADAMPVAVDLFTLARAMLFNGAAWDRARAASAADLAAQSGQGVALATPPGMWSAVSNPAAGTQATATKAAGAAGVRHIATGIVITWGAIAAPVATALTWALRDGASGAGAILAQGQLAVPAAVFQGQPVVITDVAIPGSAATAMTLEFSAALAALLEGVTLTGFDAS